MNAEQIPLIFNNFKNNERKTNLPSSFILVNETIPNGPITVDRKRDDGTKRNFNYLIKLLFIYL